MGKWAVLDWIAYVLVIIGAINWGLIGFLDFDLVSYVFGNIGHLSKVVYCLVGLAGLWMIFAASRHLR